MRFSRCKQRNEVMRLVERRLVIEVQPFDLVNKNRLRSGFDFSYGLCDFCVVVRYRQRVFLLPKGTFNTLDQIPSFATFLAHMDKRIKYYKIDKEVLDVCSKC